MNLHPVDLHTRRLPDQRYEQCPQKWESTQLPSPTSRLFDPRARVGQQFHCMGPLGHPRAWIHCANADHWTPDGEHVDEEMPDAMVVTYDR